MARPGAPARRPRDVVTAGAQRRPPRAQLPRPRRPIPLGAPGGDVVTAVAQRRSRSAQLRRRRRQIALWALVAVVVGAGSFGAGLVAAPLDYSFQPVPPQAVLLLDSSGRVFATIRAPQDQEPVA